MTKCEFYSEYICKYYENGLCHLNEELFSTPPQPCHHINDFENCIGSKPIEESREEFKNMKKCKYHLDYESGQYDFDICSYDKCKYNGFPAICTHKNDVENCACFEPIKCEKESSPSALKYDKAEPVKLMLDKSRSIDKTALTIQNCDKIILKPKSLEVEFKIEKDNFDDFDYIVINGIKFKKV